MTSEVQGTLALSMIDASTVNADNKFTTAVQNAIAAVSGSNESSIRIVSINGVRRLNEFLSASAAQRALLQRVTVVFTVACRNKKSANRIVASLQGVPHTEMKALIDLQMAELGISYNVRVVNVSAARVDVASVSHRRHKKGSSNEDPNIILMIAVIVTGAVALFAILALACVLWRKRGTRENNNRVFVMEKPVQGSVFASEKHVHNQAVVMGIPAPEGKPKVLQKAWSDVSTEASADAFASRSSSGLSLSVQSQYSRSSSRPSCQSAEGMKGSSYTQAEGRVVATSPNNLSNAMAPFRGDTLDQARATTPSRVVCAAPVRGRSNPAIARDLRDGQAFRSSSVEHRRHSLGNMSQQSIRSPTRRSASGTPDASRARQASALRTSTTSPPQSR
jgi:hypothetical protein